MNTFIGIVHVLVAFILIILVLIQDSKSDGALGIGGSSGSKSLLGATGAQTLAGKMTVWAAVIFAVTCLTLSVLTSSKAKSVVDTMPARAAVPLTPIQPTPAPATPQATAAPTGSAQPTPAASPTTTPVAPVNPPMGSAPATK